MERSIVSGDDWAGERGRLWRSKLGEMERMLAPIDAPLIEAARLDGPLRIADLACGGGGTTFRLQDASPPGSEVHGFDLSPALVETALSRRARESSLPTFAVAELSCDQPPGRPFDRLVSRFGMMFFEAPLDACRNLLGWLQPDGRFAFAVWSEPAANPWLRLARDVVARHIALPAPQPDSPGPFRYGAAGTFPALLRRAGFEDVVERPWRGLLHLGGGMEAPEAAGFMLASFSFASPLKQASEDVQRRALHALTEAFSAHLIDGQVALEASVWIVTGRRPA